MIHQAVIQLSPTTCVPRHVALAEAMVKLGYNVFWQKINTSHWGVPQNHEQVYVVAIKKTSCKREFTWPTAVPLCYTVEDMIVPQLGDDNNRLPNKTSEPRATSLVVQTQEDQPEGTLHRS